MASTKLPPLPPGSEGLKAALLLHYRGLHQEALVAAGVVGRRVSVEGDGIARVDLVANITGETYARAAVLADILAPIAKSHPYEGQDPVVVFDGLRVDRVEKEKLVAALWATYERVTGVSSVRMTRIRYMQFIDNFAKGGVGEHLEARAKQDPETRKLLAAVAAWANTRPGSRPVSKWTAVSRYLAARGIRCTADRCEKDWAWHLKQRKAPAR
jgi:hypothetical protein